MIFPARLLRGSAPSHIQESTFAALGAVSEARRAIQGAYPNARDYLTETEWSAACIDHALQDAALADVERYFDALASHVVDW